MVEQSKRLLQILYLNRLGFLYPIEKRYILEYYMPKDCPQKSNVFFDRILKFDIDNWRNFLGRGLPRVDFSKYTYNVIKKELMNDIRWLNSGRGRVCTIEDENYPYLLKQIEDPPLVLYVRGSVETLNRPSVSVVGTRNPDEEGIMATQELGMQFSNAGYNVVSGFALGIDIHSHIGVIRGKQQHSLENSDFTDRGNPVVVLGTCVDYIYPVRHRQYAQEILNIGGVFVSELPLGKHLGKHSFIARNRIISAMSMHTIVVQAPRKSGALATADFALEQGRTVWVHRAGLKPEYEGTLNLWVQGAREVDALDVS